MISDRKECFVCGTTKNLQCHHIFRGAYRNKSTQYGMMVWLCQEHHTGQTGVHNNKSLNERLQRYAQIKFEQMYPDLDFREIFGKTYKERT